jgi:septal ring factor EnvC (AmiA/AmiB activator)
MKTYLLLLTLLLAGGLRAAEPADPSAKLREQLRASLLQIRTAQTEAANAKVAQAAAEQKTADLQARLGDLEKRHAALTQQTNADKAAADKQTARLQDTLAARDQQLTQLQQTLAQWKDGYQKAIAALQEKEQHRAQLARDLTDANHTIAARQRQNLALFNTALEILDRYQNHALGKSLQAREPFIGLTRVKIENQVQAYKDTILANRLNAK